MKRLALLSFLSLSSACDPQQEPSYQGEPRITMRGSVTSAEAPPAEAEAAVLWLTDEQMACSGPALSCGTSVSSPTFESFECVQTCGDPVCEEDALNSWEACVGACEGVEVDVSIGFEGCASGGVGERVALSLQEFPTAFEMPLFELPPEGALLQGQDGGPRVATGLIVALAGDAPATFEFAEDAGWDSLLGSVTSHFIIYAADPIPAESNWGQYLGGALDPGYHLIRYDADIECEEDGCSIENVMIQPESQGFDVELVLNLGPLSPLIVVN